MGYGITKVQLTPDGVRGLLVRARRDNGNAHGFDVLSIYALAHSSEVRDAEFLVLPVWEVGKEGKEKERLELTVSGGADCKLQDFRFLVGPGSDLQLVTAQREFGTSYADAAQVTFTYFSLKHNSAAEIGRPLYYFESTTSSRAKKRYCDVNDAFKQELGFGA
ncbi:MAG: carbapenem self-resistance protein CarG family protein [Steroidobacteraceae bacterium]